MVTANSGAAYTVNLANGNILELTLTDNCILTFTNPPASGKAGSVMLILHNDLNPKHEYWFTVIPVNSCATGTWSNWLQASREKGRLSIFYRYLPEFVRQQLP